VEGGGRWRLAGTAIAMADAIQRTIEWFDRYLKGKQ
jgi:hypothetical protein